MKSLLLKDLYVMKNSIALFSFVLLVFIGLGVFAGQEMLFCMAFAFASVQSVSVFNQESACRWNIYAGGLPVNRRTQVLEKYVFILIPLAAVAVISVALSAGIRLFVPQSGEMNIPLIVTIAFLALIIPAVNIPIIYKFGPEKAAVITTLLAGILFGGLAGAIMSLSRDSVLAPSPVLLLMGILLSLALLIGSYFLSLRIYCKKDL